MPRLLILVEGQTEETFVNVVLAKHLISHGYSQVSARIFGNARQRDRRGGIRGWESARKDVLNHLKEDREWLVTTMVDYYGLPQNGDKAWPGRGKAGLLPFAEKATTVQDAMLADIEEHMEEGFDSIRFVPFVVMHEFEGLLFSDCAKFARGIGQPDLEERFQIIRNSFDSPEEINDSPLTAPSKRVRAIVPQYQKPLMGSLAVIEIGLATIQEQCPNFRSWIDQLEALAP